MKLELTLLGIAITVIVVGMSYLKYSPDNTATPNIVNYPTMCTYIKKNLEGSPQAEYNKFIGLPPSDGEVIKDQNLTALISTSEGDIEVELFASEAPCTVNSFVYLAENGFYNNLIFHRTIKDFMIQGGDPSGTGMGGPGYSFNDEKVTREYTEGILAMANSGPNTNGSQFFIMHKDTPLPPNYTIFGKVKSGQENVDKIAVKEVLGDKPVNPVTINSIAIRK